MLVFPVPRRKTLGLHDFEVGEEEPVYEPFDEGYLCQMTHRAASMLGRSQPGTTTTTTTTKDSDSKNRDSVKSQVCGKPQTRQSVLQQPQGVNPIDTLTMTIAWKTTNTTTVRKPDRPAVSRKDHDNWCLRASLTSSIDVIGRQ